ncbi:atlastin-3-like [Styela clava]
MSDVGCISLADVIDGQLRFNHDNLATFFDLEMFKDKPICIVSIAGAMKTGKSFMLTYFQRYLNSRGWENQSWIDDDQKFATDGFHWRCGIEPDTQGINVWGTPYLVKRSDGKEVAVVLMDTQGLFDLYTTKEDNVKLFTLSVLASSIQILNIKDLILKTDLENLHFCVEFAKIASSKKSTERIQLQSLLLLIRDWKPANSKPYGFSGGKSYLDGVLAEKKGKAKELNEVRNFLHETFKDLQCFLMPNPGPKAIKSNFDGRNDELDGDFLDEVKIFCESILHPDKLVIKMSGNEQMSARKLAYTLAACDEIFLGGKLPLVETLVETLAKAHYESAFQDCIDLYKGKMKVLLDGSRISTTDQVEKVHEEAFKEAIEKYKLVEKVGSEKYRKHFEKYLKEQCNSWKDETILIKKISNKLVTDYKKKMREILRDSCFSPKYLENLHHDVADQLVKDISVELQNNTKIHFKNCSVAILHDAFIEMKKINKENGKNWKIKIATGAGVAACAGTAVAAGVALGTGAAIVGAVVVAGAAVGVGCTVGLGAAIAGNIAIVQRVGGVVMSILQRHRRNQRSNQVKERKTMTQ